MRIVKFRGELKNALEDFARVMMEHGGRVGNHPRVADESRPYIHEITREGKRQ